MGDQRESCPPGFVTRYGAPGEPVMSRASLLNVTGGGQIEQSEKAVLGPRGLRALGRAVLPAAGGTRDLPGGTFCTSWAFSRLVQGRELDGRAHWEEEVLWAFPTLDSGVPFQPCVTASPESLDMISRWTLPWKWKSLG